MGYINSLQDYLNYEKQQEETRAASASSAKWFKLADKESYKIRFLQELDVNSPFFSTKNGTNVWVLEHTVPGNFRIKAECTFNEGSCYGCEQQRAGIKGWKPKVRFYINVLARTLDGKSEQVCVLSQGTSARGIVPTLTEHSLDNGGITNRWWKVSRKGASQEDTAYLATPSMSTLADDEPGVEIFDLFDLKKLTKHVPYDEQEVFYNSGAVAAKPIAVASSVDEAW